MDRRKFIIGAGAAALYGQVAHSGTPTRADGILTQPWITPLGNFAQQAGAAKAAGKPIAILWERPGCHFCAKLHRQVLSSQSIAKYLTDKLVFIQGNMVSDSKVINLDGTEISERKLSRQMGILGSPTIQYFPSEIVPENIRKQEIKRIYGYHGKQLVLDMTEYVSTGAWEDMFFTIWKSKNRP